MPTRRPTACPAGAAPRPEFWANAKAALGLDDEGLRERLGDDFRRVYTAWRGPDPALSEGATWRSPFGVERIGMGYGQPVGHPMADVQSVKEVLDYPWPDPAWVDVSRIKADADAWSGRYAILGGDWSPFWHDGIDLVGLERLYFLMYDHPEVASLLFEKATDFYCQVSANIFEAASGSIDIFFIGNDFGSQTGPLLGIDLFERFAMPSLVRLADLGHRHGLKVLMHCCGGFRPLFPQMIRAGLDGVHALQPYCTGMDPAGLKRDFGAQILLNGAIDSQSLIEGTADDARDQTRRVLDIMSPGGGYVAGASHDYILGETPLENVLAMFDTIREYREADRRRRGIRNRQPRVQGQERAQGIGGQGRAEAEALQAVNVQLLEQLHLLRRSDPFQDHRLAPAARQPDDVGQEVEVLGAAHALVHEEPVDLDGPGGQLLQPPQGGVARPEVVDEKVEARRGQAPHLGNGAHGVDHALAAP